MWNDEKYLRDERFRPHAVAAFRSRQIRERRYDWLLSTAILPNLDRDTFAILVHIELRPHEWMVRLRDGLLAAIDEQLATPPLWMRDRASLAVTHQRLRSCRAVIARSTELQCCCIVEALDRYHFGISIDDAYDEMLARVSMQGKEAAISQAELELLEQRAL